MAKKLRMFKLTDVKAITGFLREKLEAIGMRRYEPVELDQFVQYQLFSTTRARKRNFVLEKQGSTVSETTLNGWATAFYKSDGHIPETRARHCY